MRATIAGFAGAIFAVGTLAQPTSADETADFYKGKTVSIVVGHQAGTGFDVYARVLQRHLARHMPGNPTVIVQNMTGASGITAANWIANIAPRDGTVPSGASRENVMDLRIFAASTLAAALTLSCGYSEEEWQAQLAKYNQLLADKNASEQAAAESAKRTLASIR